MRYLSTRGGTRPVGLGAALTVGLAADGGLYVPEALPLFRADAFSGREGLATVATALLQPFAAGDALAVDLPVICAESLDIPAPLRALAPQTWLLELFHGPTAAFKDFGARFLAACLARLHAHNAPPVTILVATSGDTGAAVAAAFHRRPGFRVVILYPDGRVSPRQAHQLGCFGDNVRALRVAGSFDDCQALVKQALNDHELKHAVALTSANSISLGRLLPQMSYYAHAASAHWLSHGRRLNFVIPTGNLGNASPASSRARPACRSATSCSPPTRITYCRTISPVATTRRGPASPRSPTRWTSVRRATSNVCAGCIPKMPRCAPRCVPKPSTTPKSAK